MQFKSKLLSGVFLKRYKRFFADVTLDHSAETVIAHVANTGSLKGAAEVNRPCLVSPAANPERKLKFSLEAIQAASGSWVGVNTSLPNQLAKEAFENKVFTHWKTFDQLQSEVKINKETRLDLMLQSTKTGRQHFVEIKNVTMAEGETAMFPDAVTERGQKHLKELMKLVDEGHSCEILFTVQRTDCKKFKAADHIDPEYAKLLKEAEKKGVKITAAVVELTPTAIELKNLFLKASF